MDGRSIVQDSYLTEILNSILVGHVQNGKPEKRRRSLNELFSVSKSLKQNVVPLMSSIT